MTNHKTWIAPPRELSANVAFRRYFIDKARHDKGFRRDVLARCAVDLDFFLSGWCFTYSPKDAAKSPRIPWISYPFQVEAGEKLDAAIGLHDVAISKSRDQGASWLCLLVMLRQWLCYDIRSFLIGSRKQDLVDKAGFPGSLMWKLDFVLSYLPNWMRPAQHRVALHLENLDNGSIIDGESTNDEFARGDRRTAILLDEFAAVQNGHSILSATRDATNCRIFNSTPQGASGAYFDTIRKLEKTNPDYVIRMHWSQHPLRNRGLYSTYDNRENGQLVLLDRSYEFPPDYAFVRDGKLRSPWYDEQCLRAANPIEIAAELDIQFEQSAWQFFDSKVIADLIAEMCREPHHRGELSFEQKGYEPHFSPEAKGRLKVWCALDGKGLPPKGQYVVGCDVATGKGGEMSSNSVASVVDQRTGNKVAEFAGNTIEPQDFAGYCMALCRWFETADGLPAFLIHESNGPGMEFEKRLREDGYRHVFYREAETDFRRKKTQKAGWWSSHETKRILLSEYKNALMLRVFHNPNREALEECGQYVHQQNGVIEHSRSRNTIDPTSIGENHGDRVIADALAYRGMRDKGYRGPDEQEQVDVVPVGSFLWRRKNYEKQLKDARKY